jgi:hypothetical protein
MKRLLYLILALCVVFDLAAATYLWHLWGTRQVLAPKLEPANNDGNRSDNRLKSNPPRSNRIFKTY